jgi:hypothetical protein
MDDPVKGVLGVRRLRLVRRQKTRTNSRYQVGGGAKQMSGRGNSALEVSDIYTHDWGNVGTNYRHQVPNLAN